MTGLQSGAIIRERHTSVKVHLTDPMRALALSIHSAKRPVSRCIFAPGRAFVTFRHCLSFLSAGRSYAAKSHVAASAIGHPDKAE